MDYTAIDFETASSEPTSACSIAAVVVQDDVVVEKFYTLIKPPPETQFLNFCTKVNGITKEMTETAPDFPAVWGQLAHLLVERLVVAHNAAFDMRVLEAMLRYYDIPVPDFCYACTVKLARMAWPQLPSHKLDAMGEFLNVQFNHHHALEDSVACAAIPVAAGRATGYSSFNVMADKLGVTIRSFPPEPKEPKEVREARKRKRGLNEGQKDWRKTVMRKRKICKADKR